MLKCAGKTDLWKTICCHMQLAWRPQVPQNCLDGAFKLKVMTYKMVAV